jgi:hypothetical protein
MILGETAISGPYWREFGPSICLLSGPNPQQPKVAAVFSITNRAVPFHRTQEITSSCPASAARACVPKMVTGSGCIEGIFWQTHLVFVSRRKVIFIHGYFWHAHVCKMRTRQNTGSRNLSVVRHATKEFVGAQRFGMEGAIQMRINKGT